MDIRRNHAAADDRDRIRAGNGERLRAAQYAARLWNAAEHPLLTHHDAFFGRLRFGLSFAGLIDLAAIVPCGWLSENQKVSGCFESAQSAMSSRRLNVHRLDRGAVGGPGCIYRGLG